MSCAKLIDDTLIERNHLAVHHYRDLDMDVVASVIQRNLDDVLAFAKMCMRAREGDKSRGERRARRSDES